MELNELSITENEIQALYKRKLTSVEAFLRKPPLHCYDFSKIYALDINDAQTKEVIEKHRPFAVYAKCIAVENDSKAKCKLKLVFESVETSLSAQNKKQQLYANYFSFDAFRMAYYTQSDSSPHNLIIDIPSDIKVAEIDGLDINSKCKSSIEFINSLVKPDIKDYFALKSYGRDDVSTLKDDTIDTLIDPRVRQIVQQYIPSPSATSLCLKWYCRGLNLNFAIIKALLDNDFVLRKELVGQVFKVGGFIGNDGSFFSVLNPPLIKKADECKEDTSPYFLQYSSIKGVTDSRYRELVKEGIKKMGRMDILPYQIISSENLPSLKDAARMAHFPRNYREQCLSKDREVFNDLLYLATRLEIENQTIAGDGIKMKDYSLMMRYVDSLPFNLTSDQKAAVNAVCSKMTSGKKVNALIQGDVGTGKTAVAFCLALICVASGYQCALAAPYTTLANQHYNDFKKIGEALGIKTVFLSSELKTKERNACLEKIKNGEAQVIIGTHSIFGKAVEYANLGMIILDEEHKFGVVHRDNFEEKAKRGFHKIIMSATPIPKSLAATIYGEASDVISILEKPANREPIQTAVCSNDNATVKFIAKQVKEGRQAYIVCPSIYNNEDSKRKITTIEEKYEVYKQLLLPYGISMEVITGKLKADEKNDIMERYKNGQIDVLMATTVIEVGINVPNATVMVISGADNFGFSTLHQLRGRVGRGKFQSYCILQADNDENNEKLQFMCTTNDGFEIAEKDLELRGPGSLFGDRQTGDNYYISLMLANKEKYQKIREIAKNLCTDGTGKEIVKRYEELYVSEEYR